MNGKVGAHYLPDGRSRFTVWAPFANEVHLHITSPGDRLVALEKQDRGYHEAVVEGVQPGSLYSYRLNEGMERPDPASFSQPRGVHGPSEVIDPQFGWNDGSWRGPALQSYLIYEIHVGTFSGEGTFEAIIPYLKDLKDLGITAIELMPVGQFPGGRNWGYDGVYPFAVQNSYGGIPGLKRLVNACHEQDLAVVLDVIYNHLGPEGNYLRDFAPYFTDRYKTPWGAAINFDGAHSDEVRRYFIENALYWITDFHIDALRLDATHAIFDFSARLFLEDLADAVHRRSNQLNRRIYVIAESDRNDPRMVRPQDCGGYGLDAQWNDDFHHSIHSLLTGETGGYYEDFGQFGQLVKAYREGFTYSGEYSKFRKRRHGGSSLDIEGSKLVVCTQNHDQIGNRMLGERLSRLVSFDELKLAAGMVLLSPYVPLLFMGEEYGETAPFQYFTSHSDPDLIKAVQNGRREEFSAFAWTGSMPDPQSESTFIRCRLDHRLKNEEWHRTLRAFYRELIHLRQRFLRMKLLSKDKMEVAGIPPPMVLSIYYGDEERGILVVFNMCEEDASVPLPPCPKRFRKVLDSADPCWGGRGESAPEKEEASTLLRPRSFVVLEAV